jgi:hypothetical protein
MTAVSQEFWCEVLFGKYKRDVANGEVVAKPADSHLWKNIVKLWPYIHAHRWWVVGDGRSIDFCNDAWIEEGLRCDYCSDCPETILHVLLDYPLIRPMWISVVDVSMRHLFFTCDN